MLEIRPSTDADVIAITANPAIWDAISDDDDIQCYEHVEKTHDWLRLSGFVNGELIGVILIHPFEDGEMIHVNILPGFRTKYAKEFAGKALAQAVIPTYAEIPDFFPNIQRFCESFGFERIASAESEWLKNGQKYMIGLFRRAS